MQVSRGHGGSADRFVHVILNRCSIRGKAQLDQALDSPNHLFCLDRHNLAGLFLEHAVEFFIFGIDAFGDG